MNERKHLLHQLIAMAEPTEGVLAKLQAYGWDSDMILAMVTRAHIVQVLTHYVAGNLSSAEVELWADAIEGREDIGYELGYQQELAEAIYVLANPALTQALTPSSASNIIVQLKE